MMVLVTGGAGFIGCFIVDELVDKGYDVIIFDALEPQVHEGKKPGYLNPKAKFVSGDVRDYELLRKSVLNSDIIFHEAGAVGIGQSQYQIKKYVDVNVCGTANLLDILVNNKHNVNKLIIAASMISYGEGSYECKKCGIVRPKLRTESNSDQDGKANLSFISNRKWEPSCPICQGEIKPIPTVEAAKQYCNSVYAITKKTQEDMVLNIGKTYSIPVVVLRYFNVYGPRQSLSNPYTGVTAIFMSRIKNNNCPVVYEDGLQTRDFISVHDVVKANILAMEKDEANYEIFNVGTGTPITIKRVAEIIAGTYGKDIVPFITNKFRKGDVRHCYADTTKITQKLGFKSSVSFQQGMEELVEWSKDIEAIDKFDIAENELNRRGII